MNRVKLKEICRLINGRAYKQNELLDIGKYPVLRVGNFFSDKGYYYSDLELEADKYCDNGDLLFAWSASFGPKIWNGGKVIYHYHIWKMELSEKVDKRYFYYYLYYLSEKIKNEGHGGIMIHTTKAEMEEREFYLPEISKQKQISNLLAKIEKVIDERKQQLQQLDELVKARFVEMFGDPKYNKNNLVKIAEIGTLTSGGTPSRAKPEYFEGDIRWYSAGELNSLYLPDSVEHISETALKQSSAKLFNKGTLMLGMYDTAAFKMGILTEDSSSNQACANLKPKQGYNIVWLYYLFDIMKPIFLQERQGVRQKNLSLSKIKEFEVPFVSFELQNEFANFVEQVDKSKVAVQKALDEAQTLFDSLMQEYFG